ncbi:MAG: TonB-dependent receptor, partial [Burkholderiales bacterium]|nr:TonB-dependent receptor [Burkholderiales bacterium]
AWKEALLDQPDPRQIAGAVVGSIQQSAVAADRKAHAFYGELQLPIARTIEAQLAARYDKYDTADATSPKAAIKWQPMPSLLLRASYSQSFKMPTLKQLFANAGQGAINLTEAQCVAIGLPAGCNGTPAFRLTGSNPGLQPEKGKTYNLGFVVDVAPLSVSVDYWDIDKKGNITTPILDDAIKAGAFVFDRTLARYIVFQNLQNFAQSRNTGVDLDAQVKAKGTPVGNLTLRAATTYYVHQATRTTASSPWAEFNGTYGALRWRSTFSVTSEMGPWTLQGLMRGWSGYWDTTQPRENFNLLPAGGLRKVGDYDEIDLTVSYSGIKNLVLSGAVKNLFDRQPPFSATNATNNNYTQMGFAEQYTNRGRYFQLSAKYEFK